MSVARTPRVLIKIVPVSARGVDPDAPGEWREVVVRDPIPPGTSWNTASDQLAPYAPAGYQVVAYYIWRQ
jgi:hypothetical protein